MVEAILEDPGLILRVIWRDSFEGNFDAKGTQDEVVESNLHFYLVRDITMSIISTLVGSSHWIEGFEDVRDMIRGERRSENCHLHYRPQIHLNCFSFESMIEWLSSDDGCFRAGDKKRSTKPWNAEHFLFPCNAQTSPISSCQPTYIRVLVIRNIFQI